MEAKKHTLASLGRMTEEEAREYLEHIRWRSGPACPREGCGSAEVTKLQGKSTRPGVYKCRACRRPFTVTVGTIFADSHIPLAKWILAFHLMCASKKGISALQLQRMLGLGSYKSAWHMAHRVRLAMQSEPLATRLSGVVEIDETYIGGKPRKGGPKRTSGRGTTKQPVVVLVQRDGQARAFARAKVTPKSLRSNLRELIYRHVHPGARAMTERCGGLQGAGAALRVSRDDQPPPRRVRPRGRSQVPLEPAEGDRRRAHAGSTGAVRGQEAHVLGLMRRVGSGRTMD